MISGISMGNIKFGDAPKSKVFDIKTAPKEIVVDAFYSQLQRQANLTANISANMDKFVKSSNKNPIEKKDIQELAKSVDGLNQNIEYLAKVMGLYMPPLRDAISYHFDPLKQAIQNMPHSVSLTQY